MREREDSRWGVCIEYFREGEIEEEVKRLCAKGRMECERKGREGRSKRRASECGRKKRNKPNEY